jgi:hypothetical protein
VILKEQMKERENKVDMEFLFYQQQEKIKALLSKVERLRGIYENENRKVYIDNIEENLKKLYESYEF